MSCISVFGRAVFVGAMFTSFAAGAVELKSNGVNYGKLDMQFKAMHILGDGENGYDASDGTSYLVKLKYTSPSFSGFSFAVAPYINGNLFGITDFNIPNSHPSKRIARGMFVTPDGSAKTTWGEAYLQFKNKNFFLRGGNQILKTPLTKIKHSQMPNFYQGVDANTTIIPGLKLGATYVSQMALGSRSLTDYALIGEGTNSGGFAGISGGAGSFSPQAFQGEFNDIADFALGAGAPDTDGMYMAHAEYTGSKMFKAGVWFQHVDEIANNIYAQADATLPLGPVKLVLSGQFLNQSDTGSALSAANLPVNAVDTSLDYNLYGLKATLKGKGWSVYAAGNASSGDTAMFNAFGADPAYTSSIFSRNAYRENVNAYKVGLKYDILKNLSFMASYADYGQSDTSPSGVGAVPKIGLCAGAVACVASNDATEADFVLVYKPKKNIMLKLFHAERTSEYDDSIARDLTQSHTRFIMSIKY